MEAYPNANKIMLLLLASAIAILAIGNGAQVTICNGDIAGLQKCRPAVHLTDLKTPTTDCCDALQPAKYNFSSFCQYVNNPILKIMNIDTKLAMELPIKCNFKVAPSHCN
ncbi:hypothetical protein MLD38_026453 [Melastoma candidum]|uniref:Uncharacterized protein n=1 Tax=Melastoma candidum TaxID=119954 RepID=A0ACB9P251_9MYRT|nr:hypothetical protein MLD38_026453 [Melastoma candidum]